MTNQNQQNGSDHQNTIADLNNRAESLWAKGDHNEARKLFEQVLEQTSSLFGPRHPDTTSAAWNLFFMLDQAQEQTAAQQILDENLLWLIEDPGPIEDARQRQIRDMLKKMAENDEADANQIAPDIKPAMDLMDTGDWAGAKAIWESLLIKMTETLDAGHPDITFVAWHLFVCLDRLEEYEQAREILRDHLFWLVDADESVLDEFLKPMREEVIKITTASQTMALAGDVAPRIKLAMELMESGDWAGAGDVWQPLLKTMTDNLPARHPDTTVAAFYLFVCLYHLKQTDRAKDILKDHLIWLVDADTSRLDDRLQSIREQVIKLTK